MATAVDTPVAGPAAKSPAAKGNVQQIRGRQQPVLVRRPSREEALEAVRTLIRWAGDDPEREGLLGTPGPGRALLRRVLQRLRRGPGGAVAAHLRGDGRV